MLMESRAAKAFNIIYLDYIRFIGPDAAGLFFHILYMSDKTLGKPLTASYIAEKSNISKESIRVILKVLFAVGLISKTKKANVWEIVIKTPKYLNKEGKIKIVEKMFNEDLVSEEEKIDMILYINQFHKQDNMEMTATSQGKEINFETTKNPDTGESLVEFYYRTLSRIFGAKYISRNAAMEIRHLKDCMKKNNDTPELTRKFFEWIIQRAKQKNKFEQVSSLGLYPELRKHAHNALVVNGNTDAKFAPEVKQKTGDIVTNMRAVFDIFVKKGLTREEIEARMYNSFDNQAVDEFLKESFGEVHAN